MSSQINITKQCWSTWNTDFCKWGTFQVTNRKWRNLLQYIAKLNISGSHLVNIWKTKLTQWLIRYAYFFSNAIHITVQDPFIHCFYNENKNNIFRLPYYGIEVTVAVVLLFIISMHLVSLFQKTMAWSKQFYILMVFPCQQQTSLG